MTREEIIKGLNSVNEECGKHLGEGFAWMAEIFQEAIGELEQEPCKDAISRQAVEDALYEYSENNDVNYNLIITEYIDTIPPVKPQPKTGRWIMPDDGLYIPICNNCGAHPWKGYIPTVEEATEVFKYCPNCGTPMQSKEP